MDDKLKWILLAVGGYLLYDWYANRPSGVAAATDDAAASAAKAAADAAAKAAATKNEADRVAAEAAAKLAADAVAAAARQAASVNLFRNYTDETLAGEAARSGEANAVAAANARGLKYNHHQWNFFLQQVVAQPQPDPELWAPGKTTEVVTVDQYRSMRLAAGMAGLGDLGWAPTLPWSTAWSA